MLTFAELLRANTARQEEWDSGNQIDLSYRGNELAGEVGEACNIIKKLERERLGIRGSRANVGNLADELADVVICVQLIALTAKINLEDALISKFNDTSERMKLNTRLSGSLDMSKWVKWPEVSEEAKIEAQKLVNLPDVPTTYARAACMDCNGSGKILEDHDGRVGFRPCICNGGQNRY